MRFLKRGRMARSLGQRFCVLTSNAECVEGLKVRNRFVVSSGLGYIFAR